MCSGIQSAPGMPLATVIGPGRGRETYVGPGGLKEWSLMLWVEERFPSSLAEHERVPVASESHYAITSEAAENRAAAEELRAREPRDTKPGLHCRLSGPASGLPVLQEFLLNSREFSTL